MSNGPEVRAQCPIVDPGQPFGHTGLNRRLGSRGPTNLLQGLRDYFGPHTYRRLDAEGSFHTRWGQDGKEVPIR